MKPNTIQPKSAFIRSLIIHLGMIAMVGCLIWFQSKNQYTEIQVSILNLIESADLKNKVHHVIHRLNIPHTEPSSNTLQSSTESSPQTMPNTQTDSSSQSRSISTTALQRYLGLIVQRIQELKRYPKEAQFREQEGRVEIKVTIQPNGEITESKIVTETPYDSLNRAALEVIQRLGKLPPLPPLENGNPATSPIVLNIPIHYQLRK